ncbi:MAG: hypothetical protein ACM3YO_03630 [Bacteroidota bacterium]
MTRIHESQRVPILRAAPSTKEASPKSQESKGGDQLLLAEKAQGHAFFGSAYLNRRWNEAKAAYGIAESGWKEFQAAQKSGDYTRFYTNKVDPFLDGTALGPDDEYRDAGPLALLTNRMAIGETVSLSIGAGTTFPLEEFGIPNAKLDGGSAIKLTRIQKQDPNGKPLSEPRDEQGNPPSELLATLELTGRAGGAYSAKAGFTLGGTMGRYTAGMQATVGAEAEAGLDGTVRYTFAFDPSSAKDMTALADLLKRTAAEQALPGLARSKKKALTLSSHLRSIGGEGGLYAQAVGSARANFGLFRNGPDPEAETLKDRTKGLLHKFLAELRKGQLAGGGSIEAHFGATRDLKTGERTVYAKLDGTAGINGRLPLYNLVNEKIKGERTLAFTYGKDGKLKEVLIADEIAKDQFSKGLRGNIEDLLGRPFGKGGIAQWTEADAVRIRYHLKPEDWEQLSASDLLKPTKEHFSSVEVKTIHRAAVEFKASVELDLGAQVGLRGEIVGTHEEEKSTD